MECGPDGRMQLLLGRLHKRATASSVLKYSYQGPQAKGKEDNWGVNMNRDETFQEIIWNRPRKIQIWSGLGPHVISSLVIGGLSWETSCITYPLSVMMALREPRLSRPSAACEGHEGREQSLEDREMLL